MKKLLVLLLTALLLTACSGKEEEADTTITVAATAEPHATILEYVAPLLEEKGYTLEIEVLDNYFIFNRSLDNGDVDANYFQHRPFFENEVAEYGYDIVEAAGIHIEPFGIYSSKYCCKGRKNPCSPHLICSWLSNIARKKISGRVLSDAMARGFFVP